MSNRNRKIFETWKLMQDIVGKASAWPKNIRRLFWTRCVKHFDRIIMAAFVYVNGLNPEIFFEWAELLHVFRDSSGLRHCQNLFKLFDNGRYSKALYAYNITTGRYEYIDGSPRVYVNKSNRYVHQLYKIWDFMTPMTKIILK